LLGGGGGAPKTKKRIKYHLDVSASDLCRWWHVYKQTNFRWWLP
jgi:hypothetical protein